ncbi:MAG: cell wall-binding repeat-containing protein, partial [Ruminococcus sp.]|nr:cell wall-binding repeat-containing protein [Ruminococcus sp.]
IENYAPYIATGLNFPDALAGGVLAAQKGQPIYLVGKTLTNLQAMTLKNHSPKNIYIFGGSGAVSNELAYEAAASCAA